MSVAFLSSLVSSVSLSLPSSSNLTLEPEGRAGGGDDEEDNCCG